MSYTILPLLLSLLLITLTKSDPTPGACDSSCFKCLTQEDFDDGTVRLKNNNKKYCLGEDIIFNPMQNTGNTPSSNNPNAPFESCFPIDGNAFPGCVSLSNGAYAMGFFAAITIEADDIELDLSNHEIKMSKTFYIQQRFFSIIEIGPSPHHTNEGVANFGPNNGIIENTYIHDGILGLSAHSGIHGINAQNTTIENLRVYDFETAGVQFNGFDGIKMNNLIIGPSSTQVKPCGYYSNGKFLSYALQKLIDILEHPSTEPVDTTIIFAGGRSKDIKEIYNDLITSLNIAYRYFIDENTIEDTSNELYDISIDLYSNPLEIPDGASIFGISFNGAHGENVEMSNIKISDIKLNVNEIPAPYFDQCIDPQTNIRQILKGPFGDVMDLRRMVGEFRDGQVIDLGDDITQLGYVGNPLSDAQIALGLFGEAYGVGYGIQGQNDVFLKWALDEYEGESFSTLPSCTSFTCNGDIMFHTAKGIMGVRIDNIDDVRIENIMIKKLLNKSPLASYACGNYSGPHDGGSPDTREKEGGMGTDVKGIQIIGGDVIFDGYNNIIQKLVSYNGDVIGLDVKNDAQIDFDYVYKDELPNKPQDMDTEDDKSSIQIKQLAPGHEITFALLAELMVDGKYPYPNNFYACNIKIENKNQAEIVPYPPNGIDKVWCADYVPDEIDAVIGKVLPVDVKVDVEANDNQNGNVAANVEVHSINNINNNAIELKKLNKPS
eukprot:180063_1